MKAFDHIVIHYDEIGLKSGNRGYFERLLVKNIQAKLGAAVKRCRREAGQFTLTLAAGADRDAACLALSRVPGVAYFSPAYQVATDFPSLEAAAVELLLEANFQSFKINTRRHDKQAPFKSMDLNRSVGAAVLKALPDRTVRMQDPDVVLKIDVAGENSYLSVERVPGVGGLPTNGRQKVVALLSGGLDSPVAAYMMMKRGCRVILTHYQNRNQMTTAVEDKIQQLAEQLSHFQVRTVLHIIPFGDLQKEIIKWVPSKMRMLFYRHVMLRISARIAEHSHARFLVTGDSLSQVASQTYDNLHTIYSLCDLPILSPLIGLDKREIVDVSKQIGTYDISALPYDDCCTFFVPKHPELRMQAGILATLEESMTLEPLIAAALETTRNMNWPERVTAAPPGEPAPPDVASTTRPSS